MQAYSVSFTLGKASSPHGANLQHNNRNFLAPNIDPSRTEQNITYVRQDVRDAYHQLFDQAVADYNGKQRQPCRRIKDYYEHIAGGKREEAFYEIIIQFGDMETAPCGSQSGETVRQLLDEYMKDFQTRNRNLHVFNAVLHMDEASPHLHINFVPFYTQGRKNGLQTGVSLKQALIEMGYQPRGRNENQLVQWEAAERSEMERILQRHGLVREDRNAHYTHMTVEEYKRRRGLQDYRKALREAVEVTASDHEEENIRQLKEKLAVMAYEAETLRREKHSPYKAFFYSDAEKQAFVQTRLDEIGIPYRDAENGFEAQECYVEQIRKIEKEYVPKANQRDRLRHDIDRMLMMSKSFDELLDRLKAAGYEIRHGKYISVRPKFGGSFIRLKGLGAHYSETALRNRLWEKERYERQLVQKIADARKAASPTAVVLRAMQFYTIVFAKGALPMRKREEEKPYAWTNDTELDLLLALNKRINDGATLESLCTDFAEKEKAAADAERTLQREEKSLREFYDLKEKILIIYEGKASQLFTREQAASALRLYPSIHASNYRRIENLLAGQEETVRQNAADFAQKQKELAESSDMLATAEKVFGGTFVQALAMEERQRRETKYIPNGMKFANGGGI